MALYKKVKLKEGVLVQYVGVYALRWQKEWGEPSVGFVEVEEEDLQSKTAPDKNEVDPIFKKIISDVLIKPQKPSKEKEDK